MNSLTADQSEDPTFIHSRVDDLGLTLSEFRVYCHLKRRANHGVSWPGVNSIAKVCCCGRKLVMKAIAGLEARKMLVVTRHEGEGNRYRLTKPSKWIVQSPTGTGDQSLLDTGPVPLRDGDQSLTGTLRYSIEGNPKKYVPPTPLKGACAVKFEEKFVEFWNQLPKANRIGLGKTKEAWNKQVSNGSTPDEILEGIQKLLKYEKLRRQQDPNGYRALHPTTWLNQERWNDGEQMESDSNTYEHQKDERTETTIATQTEGPSGVRGVVEGPPAQRLRHQGPADPMGDHPLGSLALRTL